MDYGATEADLRSFKTNIRAFDETSSFELPHNCGNSFCKMELRQQGEPRLQDANRMPDYGIRSAICCVEESDVIY